MAYSAFWTPNVTLTCHVERSETSLVFLLWLAVGEMIVGDALEFESTANDREGWSQIAHRVESSVRNLATQS
jgi:hypothetical protein